MRKLLVTAFGILLAAFILGNISAHADQGQGEKKSCIPWWAEISGEICPPDRDDPPMMPVDPTPTAAPTATEPPPSASVEPPTPPPSEAPSPPPPSASSNPSPTTAAEEWAEEAAKSAGELASRVGIGAGSRDGDWGSGIGETFGVTFSIGLVIFAVVMIMMLARASRGHYSPEARSEFADALPKIAIYVPLMLSTPTAVHWVSTLGKDLSESFANEIGNSFGDMMRAMGGSMLRGGVFGFIGGAVLALIILFVLLIAMLVWFIEDCVAEYALYILTILIPISTALSLWPSNKRLRWRLIGAIAGCALVPAVSRFAYWIMSKFMVTNVFSGTLDMATMVKAIVVIAMSTSMPIILGYIMPALSPYGAPGSDGAAGPWQSHVKESPQNVQEGVRKTQHGVDRLKQRFRDGKNTTTGTGGSTSGGSMAGGSSGAATGASGSLAGGNATGASGGAATGAGSGAAAGGTAATGAAVGLGAAAGVVAGVVIAAKVGADAAKGAARESALRMNAAVGIGYATDPDTSGPSSPRRHQETPQQQNAGSSGSVEGEPEPSSHDDGAGEEPSHKYGPKFSNYEEDIPRRQEPSASPPFSRTSPKPAGPPPGNRPPDSWRTP